MFLSDFYVIFYTFVNSHLNAFVEVILVIFSFYLFKALLKNYLSFQKLSKLFQVFWNKYRQSNLCCSILKSKKLSNKFIRHKSFINVTSMLLKKKTFQLSNEVYSICDMYDVTSLKLITSFLYHWLIEFPIYMFWVWLHGKAFCI